LAPRSQGFALLSREKDGRAAFGGIENVVVAPGGNTYAYSYGQYLCSLYLIEGLR
jgi:hypothetical protein